jgi:beta-N-acetylhexosaminidase
MEAADLLAWFKTGCVLAAAALALIFGSGVGASSVAHELGQTTARRAAPILVRGAAAGGVPAVATVAALGSAVVSAATAQVSTEAAAGTAISHMSAAQLAGQRVIYSYPGLAPPASLLTAIRQGRVAGVIFFAANYARPAQFRAAIRALRAANASATNPARGYPLLLMTDQEGGEVNRVPGAPAESEKQIGAMRPVAVARAAASQAGAAAAANLVSHGLNVDLAPVLDVYRTPGDFDDQFGRSYSSNSAVVAALGASFITAMQARHVAATAKHFPGLGAAAARQNTDSGPVTIGASAAALRSTDESPYPAAIAAGVRLVMLSWAVYPALGSGRPAGLSAPLAQGLLRGQLGFQGVTITDAIEAGALRHYGPVPRRAALAAAAGMDLILASAQDSAEGAQAAAGLQGAAAAGTLSQASVDAAVQRILLLRDSLRP